ncbi:integrase [Rhizobium sp. BIGb0125]|uniref:hypothetical protein n=1 Tax=Rhizobium sp. BIGb0125 TaxID=2940618 RepID=UPI0021692059|nr:hypothetical protein [Rhizobium sp. BIGb0125]MCS4243818.1 integrase [Rhizobium sp. BIGb0125]
MNDQESSAINPQDLLDGDETPGESAAVLKTYLRMMHHRIREPVPDEPQTAHALAGLKGMIGVTRELKASADGNPYNAIVVENADLLKERYVRQLQVAVAFDPALDSQAQSLNSANRTAVDPIMVDAEDVQIKFNDIAYKVDDPISEAADAPPAPWIVAAIKAEEIPQPERYPAYDLDRRLVVRRPSTKPLFSHVAGDYFTARERKTSGNKSQVKTERSRVEFFIELIGDHKVDTYTASDLQAYVNAMKYWPAKPKDRDKILSSEQVLIDNVDLHLKPLAYKTILDGYVTIVKTIIGSATKAYDYVSPLAGVRVDIPDTAMPTKSVSPLSAQKIGDIFRVGVKIGYMDTAMLPLLGHLTGRRIGLLTYLQGSDFQEKFPGVYVVNTNGIVSDNGIWKRVPYKTDASLQYFILHDLLRQIGFVEWAINQGEQFIFPTLMKLADPAKSASSYMQRLFTKAKVEKGRKEVFHSLRAGLIDELREQDVDQRTSRLQAGHGLSYDIHELYGTRAITERKARLLSTMPLNPEIDYSMFQGLDFDVLSKRRRGDE